MMDKQATALDEREFLLSEAYRGYLERVVRTVSGMYDLQVVFSRDIQTDGRMIHINPLSPLLAPLSTLEEKTLAILGQLAHEYFHIAYTDFRAFRLLPAKMRRESAFRREMAYRLLNIVEDGAVERLGCEAYRGLFRRALDFSNHVAFSQMPPIDEMARRGAPALQILSQATLMQAILGRVKGAWPDASLAEAFAKAVPILEEGLRAPDSMARLRYAEALYDLYLPWIEEMEASGIWLDDGFPWIKPIWRLTPERRKDNFPSYPAGDKFAAPEKGDGRAMGNELDGPRQNARNTGDGDGIARFGERDTAGGDGAGTDVPAGGDAGGEGPDAAGGWRWDEDLGHRVKRRHGGSGHGIDDVTAAGADPSSSERREALPNGAGGDGAGPEAGPLPKAESSLDAEPSRDDGPSPDAEPLPDTESSPDAGPSSETRYRFRWKWFRFGKRRRPGGRQSRQMADADAVQRARRSEPADAVMRKANPPDTDRDRAAWDADLRQVAEALAAVQEAAVRETKAKADGKAMVLSLRRQGEGLAHGPHQGIRIFVKRDFSLTPEEREKFLRLEAETRWLAQSMIRQWQQWVWGGQPVRESGLYSGKLDERRLWRQDTRLFYRREREEDGGNLAILLLVDESGSMNEAGRWHHAQRACLVLEAVCRACGLPLAVLGHLAVYGQPHVVHHHYVDFGPQAAAQRERIVLLGPKENTREGLSLRYAARYIREAERLGWLPAGRVRPLILSISDGRPVHDADRWTLKGAAAQDDVRAAVRELGREGIPVIGVAIGDEPSAVGDVYAHAVEVRRVEDLPQRLLRTIRRWMENEGDR